MHQEGQKTSDVMVNNSVQTGHETKSASPLMVIEDLITSLLGGTGVIIGISLLIVAAILHSFPILSIVFAELGAVLLALSIIHLAYEHLIRRHFKEDMLRLVKEAVKEELVGFGTIDITEIFPDSYASAISKARKIIQIGTHLNSNLNEYYGHYETMLQNGGDLKVLIINPNSPAAEMAALRFPGNVRRSQEKDRGASSLSILKSLLEKYPKQLEVRLIDFLMEYSALLVEPGSPDSVVYVERYTFRIQGGARKPKFVFTRRDGKWFDLYKHEIHAMWEVATPYTWTGED